MSIESGVPQKLPQFELPCNTCGSMDARLVFPKWSFRIVRCVDCGLVFVNPRTFRIEEDDYFEGAYLSTIEKDGKLDGGIANLYGEIIYNLSNRVASGILLDVGCAMGHFLGFAKRYGWEVEGVECSPYAARYAEEHFGAQVHPVCDLKDANLPAASYDACVLIEVIEHLADPRATMTEVWRLLKPGGLVYITTPNFSSYRAMLLRAEWNAVIPVGHLYYFEGESLGKLLTSIGFINLEDFTDTKTFAAELEFAEKSGLMTLTPEQLAGVKDIARIDAGNGPINHRGECLVMCGRKPWTSTEEQAASDEKVGRQVFYTPFEGYLVRRPGETVEDNKVYFVDHGRKRWVTTADWIIARGMNWPEDVKVITAEELDELLPGPPLP